MILSIFGVHPFRRHKTRSIIQMIQQPKNNLMIPAIIAPSLNLVTNPQIQAVNGMIAKIKLTIIGKPK